MPMTSITKKNAALGLIVFIIVISSAVARAKDTGFMYPANKTITTASEIAVIGKAGSTGPLSLTVENNSGRSSHELSEHDGYFYREIRLAPGRNTLSLIAGAAVSDTIDVIREDNQSGTSYPDDFLPYYLHSRNIQTGVCRLCHSDGKKGGLQYKYINQQFSCITNDCHPGLDQAKFLHGPLNQKGSCIKCHNPHGSINKNFVKYSGGALCFTCHADAERMVTEAKYIHFPVGKGECTSCHDPHGSNLEFHLKRGSIADLCAGCHGKDKTSHEVLHAPVKAGDCIACHTPHVSENKGLLSADGTALCFKCHKDREEEFKRKYIHEPAAKNCTICHDPHGSATVNHLRNRKDKDGNYIPVEQPVKELCLGCHSGQDSDIAYQIEHAKVAHDPVAKGQCTICHTPHSTNHGKQLKAPLNEICFTCHQKIKELITGSIYKHGPIHTNDCAQCHLPHGSDNRKLLRSKFSDKYAETFDMDNYVLCFNCHSQDIVIQEETVSTDFRNGGKNLHYLHVNRQVKGRNCKTCHEIHASNQEKHIRRTIPFERGFTITLEFTKSATGGGCVEGCHKPRQYDRIIPVKN